MRHQLLVAGIGRRMTVPYRLPRLLRTRSGPTLRLTSQTRTMPHMQKGTGLGRRISQRQGSVRPCLVMPSAGLRALGSHRGTRQPSAQNPTLKPRVILGRERTHPDGPPLVPIIRSPACTSRVTIRIRRRTSSTVGASLSRSRIPLRKQHPLPGRISPLALAQASSASARGRWRPRSLSTARARKAST